MIRSTAFVFASLLFIAPAMAQQAPPPTMPSVQKAQEIMLSREMSAHQADLAAALELDVKVTALKKQVADLTAENAKLKTPESASPPVDPAK